MIADTALVRGGFFFHYCHKNKTLMALRVHHSNCPFCLQKNPDYISNKLIFPVTNYLTGSIIMTFSDQQKAIMYIQSHPQETWALGDTGYVEDNKNNSMS